MKPSQISTVGAWCAILVVPVLIAGGFLLSSSGAGDLIPPTGNARREWLVAVAAAPARFAAGGWLLILMGNLVLVALVSFYYVLRDAGSILILAPVLATVAMVLVTISHLIPIGMAYELAPAFSHAAAADQATLGIVANVLGATSLVVNAAGNALGWGVVVPLYAWAILKTRVLPGWIGWLGFAVAVLGGWLGVLAPVSTLLESISSIGFVLFFIFLLCVGIAILRLVARSRRAVQPVA